MKLRIKFAKEGCMKFIGHLDVMRYFQKVIRRADIDIAYSEGFSPHQIMSFAAPLGVGLESSGEYVDIEVRSAMPPAVMVERMNRVSVEGIRVLSVRELPEGSKNAMSIVAAADYSVTFPVSCPEGLREYLGQDEIVVCKKTKKNEVLLDIRPLIYEYRLEGNTLFLKLAAGSADNLKPELILENFYQARGESFGRFLCRIRRLELYGREEGGKLAALEALGTAAE